MLLVVFCHSFLEVEAQVLRALHVPLPFRQAAHGPRARVHHQRRHRTVPEDARDAGEGRGGCLTQDGEDAVMCVVMCVQGVWRKPLSAEMT